ncbi:kinase-like domain-containing protein [Glomus cerebriforme]|uniref:Kinase-like domain-containing protein n=1 Tax=Glomus cerebriforme TaxID=658196 RepID=A0A397TII4_9GLOM|nr:kinase-like domain-containing protein [Glomus cerebriforme]
MKNCTLCGKIIYQYKTTEFRLCSDCYLISSGRVDSLYEKPIPIIYLPWWDNSYECLVCNQYLDFISDCQKWCTRCYIFYSGCRYCLTTNITFGLSDKSQCRKCKRILDIPIDIIDIMNVISGNNDIDALISDTRFKIKNDHKIINDISSIDLTDPSNVYTFLRSNYTPSGYHSTMEWIPYSQITNLEKLAEGGFGIIYKAIWLDCKKHISPYDPGKNKTIAVKRLKSSQKISEEFINELKSYHKCCIVLGFVVQCHGITKDPKTDEYMLVMDYAKEGNLHDYLQKNFVDINWTIKISMLWRISNGLKNIHDENLTHRDFHSGNILVGVNNDQNCHIGDLGLSKPASETSFNDEIYGVIPYVAPEVFNGAKFSKASDIYSLGMIMWEYTTGCKPFADVEHDHNLIYDIIDGKRPEITKDTPECFANLMKRCWEFDPTKRPSIYEVVNAFFNWNFYKNVKQFNPAEEQRLELIQLKLLASSINSTSLLSLNGAIYTSRPLSALISTVNVSRKHKIEELDIEIQDSDKRNKTDENQ